MSWGSGTIYKISRAYKSNLSTIKNLYRVRVLSLWFVPLHRMILDSLHGLCALFSFLVSVEWVAAWPDSQIRAAAAPWDADHGHNKPFRPTPKHIFPGKQPFKFNPKTHYYEPHHNNEKNGTYKRASCPALNTLANRGYIPRTGRNVRYEDMAQGMRDVFNFGDDNVETHSSERRYSLLTDLTDHACACSSFRPPSWGHCVGPRPIHGMPLPS